jgi:hypothetical protein
VYDVQIEPHQYGKWCFKKFPLLQDVTRENKLRLLMVYAAVHPEKFEGDKIAKLMEVSPCWRF